MAVDDQALLSQDPDVHNMMVRGVLSLDGDHYVDGSGRGLEGAPDENGMISVRMNADGTYADQPRSYSLGPSYTATDENFHGTPMNPDGQLDYGGNGIPTNWRDFSTPTNTTTGGGFFSMDDNFAARGQVLPNAFQSGSALPSTNNYRLLPAAYRRPNYIMRNGQIIDMNSPNMSGPLGGDMGSWRSGATMGFPSAVPINENFNSAAVGWPGSISGWEDLGPAHKG